MSAMDKIRDEMAKSKGGKLAFLGEGMTALLSIHPEYGEKIAQAGKSLEGCLDAIRRGAKGGVSDPMASTKAICEYYGIEAADHARLAAEVNLALLGGNVPQAPAAPVAHCAPAPGANDFDLDALLEAL